MSRSGLGIFVLLAALPALLAVGMVRCEGTPPAIEAPAALAIGKDGRTVALTVTDAGAGPKSLAAVLVHGAGETPLVEQALGPGRWLPFGPGAPATVELVIDPKALGAKDGDATLRVTARDHAFRSWGGGNETQLEIPLRFDFRSPAVSVEPGIVYARRGGSVALAYRVGERTVRDGVELGERFFPAIRVGADDPAARHDAGWRLALFPLPIDQPDTKPVLIAEDEAGNRGQATPQVKIEERRVPEAMLNLPPSFLENKIGELAEAVDVDASDRLRAFQEINTRVRAENEKRIREVTAESSPTPLWDGAFEQMANSKVTSPFAEKRSYIVDAEKVSESTHYGYDLASLAGAPVTASNAGRVVFADELGIYGQCVIVDHGLGLFSLYGHLSSIDVAVGDTVAKGQTLGHSGQTGLAGGDHLHFAMLLAGHYVDPVEWWDAKWQRDRLDPQIAAARQ
ncbi:MAG: M23 family metallopeptidase [Deltaproteobacteria bacterium]|nr:M23 family metallopeptidase [Deltaproteobacteria bacterium]